MSMSQANPAKLPGSSAPFRARSASLQRTPSIVEPAASIVTLPEIERGPSRVSRHETIHERRESGAFSEKDEEAVEDGTYRAEEVTFPDGGLKVSSLTARLAVDRMLSLAGMAMCRW